MKEIYNVDLTRLKKGTNYYDSVAYASDFDDEVLVFPYSPYYVKEILTGKKIRIMYPTLLNGVSKKDDIYAYFFCKIDLTKTADGLKTIKEYLEKHKNIDEWRKELDMFQSEFKNEIREKNKEIAKQQKIQKQEKDEVFSLIRKMKSEKIK